MRIIEDYKLNRFLPASQIFQIFLFQLIWQKLDK